jgi:DNA gyrase subunit A
MQHVPGPDFPTAGIINGAQEIVTRTRPAAAGSTSARARTSRISTKGGAGDHHHRAAVPGEQGAAARAHRRAGAREAHRGHRRRLRDESDKDGMRVVIELKRGEVADIVLNNLYKQTPLETVFGINMVALQSTASRGCSNLKEMLEAFLRHRREVVTRRTIYDLRKARERAHVLEGLRPSRSRTSTR